MPSGELITHYSLASGFALSIEGMEFEPNRPFRACLLCGRVYQPYLARQLPYNPEVATLLQRWANYHAKTHPQREHNLLKASGRSCTPEAAKKLAAYGVIPITDMVMDEEVKLALLESNPMPTDDVEGD